MNKFGKIAIVVVLIAAVVIVIVVKQSKSNGSQDQLVGKGLPALIDLGADKCIPCKMMAPILEELQKEYASRLEVIFIDVWKNPGRAKEYGIQLIPTQIFYGASGKELFRHEGFMSKEDILAKWAELGIELTKAK